MTLNILTALLVLVTAFYAWVTFRILRANERVVDVTAKQAEAISRPYIAVSPVLEPDNPIFYLRIKNIGKTSALNLKLGIDKSFYKFGEQSDDNDLSQFAAFNDVISSFPPDSEMTFALAQGFVVFAKDADPAICPSNFCVTAKYDYGEKTVEERHPIDLRPYLNADVPQNAIIRKIKDANEHLKKISQRNV